MESKCGLSVSNIIVTEPVKPKFNLVFFLYMKLIVCIQELVIALVLGITCIICCCVPNHWHCHFLNSTYSGQLLCREVWYRQLRFELCFKLFEPIVYRIKFSAVFAEIIVISCQALFDRKTCNSLLDMRNIKKKLSLEFVL